MFGTRAEMIQLANERMAASPGKYFAREGEPDPALWGYDEVGGVNVLYISNISLDFLGWRPDLGEKPLPALTWAALAKVPPIVGVVAAAMTGTYWFIGRRMRVQEEAEREAREAAQRNAPESEG
jgi:hypothetical protein